MIKGFLNRLHHMMSASGLVVKTMIVIRNQCNAVVQYYISNSPNSDENGENFIIKTLANECSQVMDIGANKGEWTEYFLACNPNINSILYDPSLQAAAYLNNKFSKFAKVSVINKAISDVSGEAFFFEEPDMGETSSLVSSFSSDNSKKVKVNVSTVDDELERLNILSIDYLKIDVEGFDFHVLKGAGRSLENKKINYLQFEYNRPWANAGSTLIHAISFLTTKGYDVFVLRKGGLYHFNYARYGDFFEYSNFFAVSPGKRSQITNLIAGSI